MLTIEVLKFRCCFKRTIDQTLQNIFPAGSVLSGQRKFASPKGCIGQDLKPVRRNLGQKPQTFDFIYIQVVAQSSRHIHTGQIFHPDSTVFQQEGNACCDGSLGQLELTNIGQSQEHSVRRAENLLPFHRLSSL